MKIITRILFLAALIAPLHVCLSQITSPDVTTLRSLSVSGVANGSPLQLLGYYSANDGGGGVLIWNSSSTAADDGGITFAPTGVATGRWIRQFSGAGNVRWFGAKGDGTTDDTSAIEAAILGAENQGAIYPNIVVYFPAGVYRVTAPGALSINGGNLTTGLSFRGDGMYNSIIRCSFASGGWLWDNAASGTHFQQTQFTDLGFEGMNPAAFTGFSSLPTNVGAFKMTRTSYAEQGFLFRNCRFDCFWKDFDFEGSDNASENKFFGCKFFRTAGTVYTINNPQSFNHEFYGCDFEENFNDIFLVTTGGAVKVYGGSVIMEPDGTSTDRWFYHQTGGPGQGALPVTFNGIRFEFRGNYANAANISNFIQTSVGFTQCVLEAQNSITKASFGTLGAYATMFFTQCQFMEAGGGTIQFLITTASIYGENGTISFDGCALPPDWSDRCILQSGVGNFSARNCYNSNIGAGAPNRADDFDANFGVTAPGQVATWSNAGGTLFSQGGYSNNHPHLKSAWLKVPTDYWTVSTDVGEHTLKLPANAIIVGIHVLKNAATSDGSTLTWVVGNNDKSIAHLTCPAINNNIAFQAHKNDYYYNVGTSTNDRTLRLYVSSGTPHGTLQGGFVLINYY
jgi:hypothetical protein